MRSTPARDFAPRPRIGEPIHEAQRSGAQVERGAESGHGQPLHHACGISPPPCAQRLRVGHAQQRVSPVEQQIAATRLRGIAEGGERRVEHVLSSVRRHRQCATVAEPVPQMGLHVGEVVGQLPFAQQRDKPIGVGATRRDVPAGGATYHAAER